MFEQLNLFPGSTFYVADSHAKTPAPPATGPDLPALSPDSGTPCTRPSARSNRPRSSSKTPRAESLDGSTKSAKRSWKAAIECVPCASELVTLALRTIGTESSCSQWPTLLGRDGHGGPGFKPDGRSGGNLEDALKSEMFPTLTATSYGTNAGGANAGHERPSIERLFKELASSETPGELFSTLLASAQNGSRNHPKPSRRNEGDTLLDQLEPSSAETLNPDWCEMFMGFVPGWTDLPRTAGPRRETKTDTSSNHRRSFRGRLADPTEG
jgi:hypothetical protein